MDTYTTKLIKESIAYDFYYERAFDAHEDWRSDNYGDRAAIMPVEIEAGWMAAQALEKKVMGELEIMKKAPAPGEANPFRRLITILLGKAALQGDGGAAFVADGGEVHEITAGPVIHIDEDGCSGSVRQTERGMIETTAIFATREAAQLCAEYQQHCRKVTEYQVKRFEEGK